MTRGTKNRPIIVPDAFATSSTERHGVRITRHAIDRASVRVLDRYTRTRLTGPDPEGLFAWLLRLASIAVHYTVARAPVPLPVGEPIDELHLIVLGVHMVLTRAERREGEPMPDTGWALSTVYEAHPASRTTATRRRARA